MIFSGHLPAFIVILARCAVTNCPRMMRLITDLARQEANCVFCVPVFDLIELNGNLSASICCH